MSCLYARLSLFCQCLMVMIVFSVYGYYALIDIGDGFELLVFLLVEFFCDYLDRCVDKTLLWGRA